jgi:hypothetical protein
LLTRGEFIYNLQLGRMMLGSLWKIYQGSGLDTLLVDANVFVGTSACVNALSGKHYIRGVRAYTQIYEMLQCAQLNQYLDECRVKSTVVAWHDGGQELSREATTLRSEMVPSFRAGGKTTLDAIRSPKWLAFNAAFDTWVDNKAAHCGKCAAQRQLTKGIAAMLSFLWSGRTIRHTELPAYLAAMDRCIPFLSSGDRNLYLRISQAQKILILSVKELYGVDCWKQMLEGLLIGVQRSSTPFTSVHCDFSLEQDINGFLKAAFLYQAVRGASVQTQMHAAPNRIQVRRSLNALVGPAKHFRKRKKPGHSDKAVPRTKRDRVDAVALYQLGADVNFPCDCDSDTPNRDPTKVVHFSTSAVAPEEVSTALRKVQELGTERARQFREKRFLREGDTGFVGATMWDTVKNLQLCSWVVHQKRVAKASSSSQLSATSQMAFMLSLTVLNASLPEEERVVVYSRELVREGRKDCLCQFELVPSGAPSVYKIDGSMRSASKTGMAVATFGIRPQLAPTSLLQHAALHLMLVDCCAKLQQAPRQVRNGIHVYVVDLIYLAIRSAFRDGALHNVGKLAIIADPYPLGGSAKDATQVHRAGGGDTTVFDTIRGYESPASARTAMLKPGQIKRFLGSSRNKRLLLEFAPAACKQLLCNPEYNCITEVWIVSAGGVGKAVRLVRGSATETSGLAGLDLAAVLSHTAQVVAQSMAESAQPLAGRHTRSNTTSATSAEAGQATDETMDVNADANAVDENNGLAKWLGDYPGVAVKTEDLDERKTNLPEADQILVSAAAAFLKTAGPGAEVTIASDDTDVKVGAFSLLVGVGDLNSKVSVLCGKGHDRKRLDVRAAALRFRQLHGDNADLLTKLAIIIHCLSGCDTVPFPFFKSKKKVWATVVSMVQTTAGHENLRLLLKLGGNPVELDVLAAAEIFFARLYDDPESVRCDDVRGIRWTQLQVDAARNVMTSASFKHHVDQASSQIELWNLALTAEPTTSMPKPRGFERGETLRGETRGQYVPIHAKPIAPTVLLQARGCGCQSARQKTPHFCRGDKCPCFLQDVPCGKHCRCCKGASTCQNTGQPDASAIEDEASADDTTGTAGGAAGPPVSVLGIDSGTTWDVRQLVDRKMRGNGPRGGGTAKSIHFKTRWVGAPDWDWNWQEMTTINFVSHFAELHRDMCCLMGVSKEMAAEWFAADSLQSEVSEGDTSDSGESSCSDDSDSESSGE